MARRNRPSDGALALLIALAAASCQASSPAVAPTETVAPPAIEPAPAAPSALSDLSDATPAEPEAAEPEMELTEHGVGVIELRPGSGVEAASGDRLEVHYVGRLEDGTVFDSSRDRGTPFRFELGAGIVIAGWDEGLAGMRVGETRRLIVPPSMGYGSRKVGPIPADAILEFEIELLSLTPPSP